MDSFFYKLRGRLPLLAAISLLVLILDACSGPTDPVSNEGKSWSAATLPKGDYWQAVAYGDGAFVAIPYKNSSSAATTDAAVFY